MHPARILMVGLFLTACDGGAYDVVVAFDPTTLADAARSVELRVVASCDDPDGEALTSATLRRGEGMALGELEPGAYGLAGRALGADCAIVAEGCLPFEVEAGGAGTLRLVLTESDGAPGCDDGVACDDGVCGGAGVDAGPIDGGPADGGPTDAGPCPGGCDDGVDCTNDRCGATGCENEPDDDACPGGGETCQPTLGCRPACVDADDCDDGDPCTVEACDAGRCAFRTRDLDDDGYGDATCEAVGGASADDCDDGDDAVHPDADEVCNGVDDDCDATSDEDFECARGAPALCAVCGISGTQACSDACTLVGACTTAPPSGTVALWSFDEASLAGFDDATGTHDGTWNLEPAFVAGPRTCGSALDKVGAQYGIVPNSSAFDLMAGSISMWVRFDTDGSAEGLFSRDEMGQDSDGHFTVFREATGEIWARRQDRTSMTERCTSAPVLRGQWIHVVARFGPPNLELIVDGVLATGCDPGIETGGTSGNANPIVLGASQRFSDPGTHVGSSRFFDGAMDQVLLRSGRATGPAIESFALVDAATDVALGPFADGDTVDAAAGPINFRMVTAPGVVGSVWTQVDGDPDTDNFENLLPYTFGDDAGDYDPLTFVPGRHVLRARAFSGSEGSGTAGPMVELHFTVR